MELFFQHIDKDMKFFSQDFQHFNFSDWNYFSKNIKNMLEKHLQFE
jgi:hypothetical protein